MENFFSQTLPNWIIAIAAAYGVIEIIRGYFKLKRQQKESEQKLSFFSDQLNEVRKQTTQFEYQSTIMSENNRIMEQGIRNLLRILGKGQEVEDQRLEMERQKRISDIRPFFIFNRSLSNPMEFALILRNAGEVANNLKILDISTDFFHILPFKENLAIDKGQELNIIGRPNSGFNANSVSGQILLGYSDLDGNQYQQNLIKNNHGYQIGLPIKRETKS